MPLVVWVWALVVVANGKKTTTTQQPYIG